MVKSLLTLSSIIGLLSVAVGASVLGPSVDVPLNRPPFVIDRIESCMKYEKLHPLFEKAFSFLRRSDLAELTVGRYEIEEGNCWAIIQECRLKPFGDIQRLEVHRSFIDIQAPIDGPETYGLADTKGNLYQPFDEGKDVGFADVKTLPVTVRPGEFAIFFPVDGGHAPGKTTDLTTMRKKIVIKVRKTDETKDRDPVKVIFDTDMYTDFDDAGALACLHALADAGECEILATIANTRKSMSVAMCEIINTYYGRPDIPVGCVKGIGKGNDRGGEHQRRYGPTVEKFARWVKHRNSDEAPDAAEVYRRVLSTQPDHSVVICSVGFLSNLRKLMETDSDLVARKVKLWVAMACSYPNGKEYNSMKDAESSRIALEKWPTPIVFTDFQYGVDCFAGRVLAEKGGADNPVADVFRVNVDACNGRTGRSAWDETAVLIAVRGVDSYFNVERGTYRMVGTDGHNEWIADPNARDCRVTEKLPKASVGKIIDELICRSPRR